MPSDMAVTVIGDLRDAENATRMVFGENADLGPVRLAPAPLLGLKDDWPVATDLPLKVALHLPQDFDIGYELGKGERKAVVLMVNRLTVLHLGKAVGYAIRTDQAGLNAITVWERTMAAWEQKLRNAH